MVKAISSQAETFISFLPDYLYVEGSESAEGSTTNETASVIAMM